MQTDSDSLAPRLALTGERTVPGAPREGYWFARHLVAYDYVTSRWAPGACTLDAGSGEGYGAELLRAGGATRVLALEYDLAAAQHSALRYPQIATVRANLVALPAHTASIDLLVSLQVVEHIWDLHTFLMEVRRVLASRAVACISTPNRLTFSPGLARGSAPMNPFHVEEFDAAQLSARLCAAGMSATMCGVTHGARIADWERRTGTSIVAAQVAALFGHPMPPDLWSFVESVTVDDFSIGVATDDCLDLLAIAKPQ